VLVALDGEPVKAVADVRLALWDKVPGDRVRISVRRKRLFWAAEHDFDFELAAARESGEDD
jgi:S1-C subfamily serine protease